MLSVVFFGVTAGIVVVGDGLYLDRCRRTATDYKKKVKARRAALADETKLIVEPKITVKFESTKFPDLSDREGIHTFYNEEIQLTDMLFEAG